jgi:NNP family nitrate/nitrite transporter-like MFS transporter
MRAFHLNWAAFFITFATTFAPAALLPVLRDSLELTQTDIGNGGIASVCGAIGSRLVMGTFTDMFGPR